MFPWAWEQGERLLGGLDYVRVVGGAFKRSMTNYGHGPDYLGLKPKWKSNLCLLLLVAIIVSVSIFAFTTIGGVMSSRLESEAMLSMADSQRRTIDLSNGLGRNALVFDEDDVV